MLHIRIDKSLSAYQLPSVNASANKPRDFFSLGMPISRYL